MNRNVHRTIMFLIPFMAILVLGSCAKDFLDDNYHRKEIFNTEYKDIYGTWRLVESISAVSGSFEADFDHLDIYTYGNFKKIRNDTILQKGVIEIIEQTSSKLKIDFIPIYAIPTGSKWVRFYGIDTLRLTDSCSECNSYVLVRE